MRLQKVLWFDHHIGEEGNCTKLKALFQQELLLVRATEDVQVDPIDELISSIREVSGLISFADNLVDALELIQIHAEDGKEITVICSGKFAQELIPTLKETESKVSFWYIFCGYIPHYKDWGMELLEEGFDIQMFDHEQTLLVRLAKDFCSKIIEAGRKVIEEDPSRALSYFLSARTLGEAAARHDTPNDPNDNHKPYASHRPILDGENGLIRKAEEEKKKREK